MKPCIILFPEMDSFNTFMKMQADPELRKKTVFVDADLKQGRWRGVVLTCSYEARHLVSGLP